MKSKRLKVSVSVLAEFSCRSGNLELGGTIGPTAREGIKAHQRIQSKLSADAEVRLSTELEVGGVLVSLSGRVDLLDKQTHRISEIKSAYVPADKISESKKRLQWAQLKLYGFCYLQTCIENKVELPSVELELIHADIRAETETVERQSFDRDELHAFTSDALRMYVSWHQLLWTLQADMRASAADLPFPFPEFRVGQRDMAAAIFRSVRDGDTLLCEAPTGTGKTLSSLFPVVKAIGEGHVKHAVYLTAKTSGRISAMQAIKSLESAGLKTTSVILRSKAPTCFCSNGRCERDDNNTCPMTVGFFDRLPAAREEAIQQGVLDGDKLDEIAWQHQLCPFELALQLLPWVDLAVADFNYVFDPLVRIARFSEKRNDTVLLIDEAHNLLDRSRGMHSGHLDRKALQDNKKLLGDEHVMLSKLLGSMVNALSTHAKQKCSTSTQLEKSGEAEHVGDTVPEKLIKHSGAIIEAYTEALDRGGRMPEELFDTFKMACRFAAISDLYGKQHRTVTQQKANSLAANARKNIVVNLKCLDGSSYLAPQYKLFRSTIVFSATLRPAPFYRDSLGLPESTQQLLLASPFALEQAQYCVVPYINTRYQYRDESLEPLVLLLKEMTDAKPGNYMVFLPSYAYLDQLLTAFRKRFPDIATWHQSKEADAQERDNLLKSLQSSEETRLGFAILGGVFGEGIDYVGEQLIGVAIIGVGLPGIGTEQELIAESYREQGMDGFDYAYRYPGFTKVLQTAGRVIRSESDRGVVLLVDDRFTQSFYRRLFPSHWQATTVTSPVALNQLLRTFWAAQTEFELG